MALASCKHIAKSPSPSLRRISDDGFSSRITFLESDSCERSCKSRGSRAASDKNAVRAPSLHPSAHLQAVSVGETISAERAQVRHGHGFEALDVEDRPLNLLTELNRSQLESQWACSEEAQKQGSSTRLSARQRRILSRRQENGSYSAVQCLPSDRGMNSLPALPVGMQRQHNMDAVSVFLPLSNSNSCNSSLSESLGTVSTLGFMRGRAGKELLTKEEEALLSKKMKIGQNLRAVRKRLAKASGHEPSDESLALTVKLSCRELQARLQEADQARDYMFLANLRLVVSVAKKYSSLGINLEDLTQEGAAGLLRGLEKFDYKKGFKLSTYIHWWIRQGITQALGQHSKTVRIPPYMYARLSLIIRTMAEFKEDGVPISARSLSSALDMSEETISVALKATKKIVSLDKPKYWGDFSPDGDSMHNYIADPCLENNPWSIIDNMFLREHLNVLITSTLCKREQDIVRLYYGFEGQGIPYHRIGQRMGISRERVRQLENRALRKLVVAGRQMNLGVPLAS